MSIKQTTKKSGMDARLFLLKHFREKRLTPTKKLKLWILNHR